MNPFTALNSMVDEMFMSASLFDAQQIGLPAIGNSPAWQIGSGNHNLQYVMSPQLTKSGTLINGESMLRIAAVFDSVRMISEDISKLPLNLKERTSGSSTRIVNELHPLYYKLAVSPDGQIRSKVFWETMIAHALVWGNGYALIDKLSTNGFTNSLTLIHPSNVVARKTSGIIWYKYTVVDEKGRKTGETRTILGKDMYHLHGVGDGVVSWPVANFALESMGLTLSVETYQAAFMGNGGHISGVLQTDAVITDKEIKRNMVESFQAKSAGINNTGNVTMLSHGVKYIPIDMKFTDAQVLQTREHQVQEVARWFRIPLHKLAVLAQAAKNNMEQENLKYAGDTLGPWITRIEDEIQFKLLPVNSKFFVKFNRQELTMSDSKARAEYNFKMFQMGSINPNEIRESEDMNPYPGGDIYYIPQNTATIEEIQARPEILKQASETAKTAAENPAPEASPEEGNTGSERKPETKGTDSAMQSIDAISYKAIIVDSFQRVVEREIKYEANPKRDKTEFYNRQEQLYHQGLDMHLKYLDMSAPPMFLERWNNCRSTSNKAEQMADEIITYYYNAQNLADQEYSFNGKTVIKEGMTLRYA